MRDWSRRIQVAKVKSDFCWKHPRASELAERGIYMCAKATPRDGNEKDSRFFFSFFFCIKDPKVALERGSLGFRFREPGHFLNFNSPVTDAESTRNNGVHTGLLRRNVTL